MKTMKNVTALLLALMMVLSLAACGGKTDNGGKDDPAVVLKVKDGYAQDAAALLQTGYQQVLDYCRMYSMNVAQVEQARLVVSGDYVALLILGQGPDDSTADEAKLAQDEAAKVDAAWQDIFGSAANQLVVK